MEQPKDIGTKTDLYKYRLESSKEALESAEELIQAVENYFETQK